MVRLFALVLVMVLVVGLPSVSTAQTVIVERPPTVVYAPPPAVVVLDSESGEEKATVPIPGDTDDVFLDAKRQRLYASCGEGFLAVIRQADADHYELLEKVPTIKGARTCLLDPEGARLYLLVPRQAGKEGPEVWVYEVKP